MRWFYLLVIGFLVFVFLYAQSYSADKEATIRLPFSPDLVEKKKDITGTVTSVKVVVHKSYEELAKAFATDGHKARSNLWGWQQLVDGICEIHVVEPKYIYQGRVMSTWGHELAHCVYGAFHD